MVDYSPIQKAFLDGMSGVFRTLFTESVGLCFLDEELTDKNSTYQESDSKFYLPPINLAGKVTTSFRREDLPVGGEEATAIFTIPTKEFITNEILCETPEDRNTLKKAQVTFKGVSYTVLLVVPKTLVADLWQFYDLFCQIDDAESFQRL